MLPSLLSQISLRASYSRLEPSSQGFSVVEILVAMMVMMIALTVVLQMFISAAYLRIRSQQNGDEYQWVWEDFEWVRSQAASFESDVFPDSIARQNQISVGQPYRSASLISSPSVSV